MLIKAGRLLEVKSGTVLTNQGILVENDRIKEVGTLAEVQKRASKEAKTIDLKNSMVAKPILDQEYLVSAEPQCDQ